MRIRVVCSSESDAMNINTRELTRSPDVVEAEMKRGKCGLVYLGKAKVRHAEEVPYQASSKGPTRHRVHIQASFCLDGVPTRVGLFLQKTLCTMNMSSHEFT